MLVSGSEIWWVLVVGMSTLLTLGIVFIASIVLHQHRLKNSYDILSIPSHQLDR